MNSNPDDLLRIMRAAKRGSRRGRAGAGGGCGAIAVLLFVGFGWFASALRGCGCAPDDGPARAQREADERAKRQAEVDAKAAEEGRKNEAILAGQRAVASAEAAEFRSKLQRFWAMTPAEREQAIRDACVTRDGCTEDARQFIADAGSDEPERRRLATLGRALWAPYERAGKANEARLNALRAQEERKDRAERSRGGGGGMVCCCDGSVSPTCTTVHRGCCSHHGGVCACR